MDFELVKRVHAALETRGVQYAIVGAAAMNVDGLARATQDLHIFIAPEEANIDRLKVALRDVFDDPEIESISAHDLLGDYPAVQYVPPQGAFHIDILTRLGEAFAFVDLEIQRAPYQEIAVNVVTPRTLYQMKKDTVRLQDRADADLVRRRFKLEPD